MNTYPKLAEAGTVPDTLRSVEKTVEARNAKGKTYWLTQATAGYEPAGAMLRWTDGYWAVTFRDGGASNGRRFRPDGEGESQARLLFDTWTQPSHAR